MTDFAHNHYYLDNIKDTIGILKPIRYFDNTALTGPKLRRVRVMEKTVTEQPALKSTLEIDFPVLCITFFTEALL